MGKIKELKKSTLSGRTENDDYKIYPVTKTDAVFTDDEDKDECDTQTPQGANKTVKEIFNSIRKKGWVNNERIKDGAVTSDKLGAEMRELISSATGVPESLIKDMEQWNNRIATLEGDKPANQIYDDVQQKDQETINSELIEAVGTGSSVDSRIASAVATETSRAQEAEANRYTKNETYTKEEVNNLITTPNQEYVSVTTTDQTTAVTDVLPATGAADTVYRVGNWDGSQYDVTKYSEYAWNGKDYVHLSTKTQIGDVFDISAYHATGGTLATYDNLKDALGTNGENVPVSERKGGMSVKFIKSIPATYNVEKTDGLAEVPSGGTLLETAPSIKSGIYTASQLSAFATLPESTSAAAVVYYITVTVDETTTYTTWSITMATAYAQKYEQYRLMKDSWSTVVTDWQGVDNEPTAGSNNLVKSGGVYDAVNHPRYVNINPEILENKHFSFARITTSYYGTQWDGTFGDNNNKLVKASSCLIAVNSGDKYLLTATIPWTYWGSVYPTIVFFDLNNVIIKFAIAVFANTPITVPDAAVKMGIMFHPDYNFLLKKDTLPELDSIETEIIESDIIKSLRIRENYSFTGGGINNSGKVGTVASMSPIGGSNPRCAVIECKEKDIFYVEIKRQVSRSSSIWAFLDNNNTILATSEENLEPYPNVVNNVESYTGYIVAPKDTAKLVVNADMRYKYILRGIYNTQDVGNMSIEDFAPVYLTSTEVTKMTPSIGNIKIGDNVSINGDEDSTVSGYYVRAFSVSGEDVIKVSSLGFAIILDEENNVIYNPVSILYHYIDWTFYKGNNILVMPSNAKTLLLYSNVLSKIRPEAEIIGNYKRVLDLDNNNIGINETWRLVSNLTFSTVPDVGDHAPQTAINTNNAYINTAYFECTEGDIFSIQSETGGYVLALITDENDIVLVKDSNAAGYLNITAPSGASHIFIQVQQTDAFNKYNGKVFRNSIIEQQAVTINQFASNSIYPYDFIVAPTFYAVKGYQKNVYQDNLICGLDCGLDSPSGLYISIASSIAQSYGFRSRSLRMSPTTTGTDTLRLEAYNSYLNKVKDKSVNFVVSDAVGLNNNHNVIIIGDSLIAGGGIAKFTRDRFSKLGGVTPTFVGSKSSTVDGENINHEGIGGVRMAYFSGTSSPFYIGGKLDVTAYKAANNIVGDIDLAVFQLGVNDAILGGTASASSLIPIINAFLEDSPNCKFIVQMTTADANTQGAGWEVYGANNRYKMSFTRNIWNTRKSILDTFNTAKWNGTVYIGDAVVGLDRYYGYPYEITKDNEWEPIEEFRHTNSVHPNEYGNRMLADGYFFLMLHILQNMES